MASVEAGDVSGPLVILPESQHAGGAAIDGGDQILDPVPSPRDPDRPPFFIASVRSGNVGRLRI